MTDLLDRRLRQLHHRRRWQRVIVAAVPWFAWSAITTAVLIAGVRWNGPDTAWLTLPLLAAGLLVPLLAIPAAWRSHEPAWALAGRLDEQCGAEGLIMAVAEQPASERDPDWQARLRQPLEDWRGPAWRVPQVGLLAIALLICLLAPWVPVPQIEAPLVPTWMRVLDRTAERLATFEREGLLPEEEATDLERQVERLREHAGKVGLTQGTWAGVDAVERALDHSGRRAAQRLGDALAAAEGAGVQAGDPAANGSAARMARSLAELARQAPGLVPNLAEDGENGRRLRRLLRKAMADGQLTEAQVQALQKAGIDLLRQGQQRQVDAAAARALAQRLAKMLGDQGREGLKRAGCRGPGEGRDGDGPPGRGGITRGPGHADLDFSHDTVRGAGDVDGLPPGARLNPDGSITLATQERAAELDDAATRELVRAQTQVFDPGAADARRVRVAPRHRAVVGAYFQDPEPEETP